MRVLCFLIVDFSGDSLGGDAGGIGGCVTGVVNRESGGSERFSDIDPAAVSEDVSLFFCTGPSFGSSRTCNCADSTIIMDEMLVVSSL